MNKFSDHLKTLIAKYQEVQENKNHLEDKTAFVMTNSKYYENQRHAFSHLINALALESEGDPQKNDEIHKLYTEAFNHIDNLDVNGYEYLAGYFLTELREKIENSGLYADTGKAENLRDEAVRHFDKGRDLRPSKKKEAMGQFEKCIDLCTEASREIVPVTKVEKRNIRINITTMIFSIIAVIIAVLIAIFK